MKRIILIVVGIAAVGGLIFAYREMSKERAAEAEREKPVAAESRVSRNAAGETVVTVDQDTQTRLALEIAPLAAAQLPPEVKGYGRVLDPTPLSTLVADWVAARAAAEASQKDFERLKVLSVRQNASERALQVAEAAAQRDKALTASARQHLLAAWGKAIADRADLQSFVQSLSTAENALVRIDLLAGEHLQSEPLGVRVSSLSDENHAIEAEYLGSTPTVDAQTQGQGFLFLVKSKQFRFAPGAAVFGRIRITGEAQAGVEIPRSAVVRSGARAWVYLQTGGETFTRREASEGQSLGNGWFMARGLKPGDRVVVRGAQMLLSEEQKYQIRMGD